MQRLLCFDNIETLIKDRVNITMVKRDKVNVLRAVGFDPFGLTGSPKGMIFIEKNTHEVLNIKEAWLAEHQMFVGDYDGQFIDGLVVAYLEEKARWIKNNRDQKKYNVNC